MERLVYVLLSAILLMGCSVHNHIVVTENEEDGLKRIRLVQSPEVRAERAGTGLPGSSLKDASTIYLFEEKTAAKPQMTLKTDLFTDFDGDEAERKMLLVLDKEEIPLSVFENVRDSSQGGEDSTARERIEQKYLIPENLWLSIVHSEEISYRYNKGEELTVFIYLNQKEKEMLSEFMKMAIRQRDLRFPDVPEGQVKW